MRSLQTKLHALLTVCVALALALSACSGSDVEPAEAAEQVRQDEQAAPTSAPAQDTEPANDVPAAASLPDGQWVIEVAGGRVVASPDETICLTLPGGNFTVSGGGDNGFGAQFFFSLSNEGGNEFSYEVAGNRTAEIDAEGGGEVTIDFDPDTGATTAVGATAAGGAIAVSGTC